MAKANLELINALKKTAESLKYSQQYQWGHMGSCNCGHLAQELTKLNKTEIHSRAMKKQGDWSEQLNDYCPTSGLLMDDLITELLNVGLGLNDLKHLEKLSDPEILSTLPSEYRYLKHNRRDHVVMYMKAWAELLESKLIDQIMLSELEKEHIVCNSIN